MFSTAQLVSNSAQINWRQMQKHFPQKVKTSRRYTLINNRPKVLASRVLLIKDTTEGRCEIWSLQHKGWNCSFTRGFLVQTGSIHVFRTHTFRVTLITNICNLKCWRSSSVSFDHCGMLLWRHAIYAAAGLNLAHQEAGNQLTVPTCTSLSAGNDSVADHLINTSMCLYVHMKFQWQSPSQAQVSTFFEGKNARRDRYKKNKCSFEQISWGL